MSTTAPNNTRFVWEDVLYLAGESSTAMSAPPTIRINNDLASCDPRITLRSANNESPTRLNMVDCLIIQKVLWDDLLDNLLLDFLTEFLGGDFSGMLS
jgi:hypothetical protein